MSCSLTVGYVFSASHKLPRSTEFPTYDSIRVHWKKQVGITYMSWLQSSHIKATGHAGSKQYISSVWCVKCCVAFQHGVILPDKQSLFYQIFFKSNSTNFFRYICMETFPLTSVIFT